MKAEPYYLGIDWGGTNIKLGAVTADGHFLVEDSFDSPQQDEISKVVGGLLDKLDSLVRGIGRSPVSIGIGLTGPVDPEHGVVLLPGKVKGLEGYPIVDEIKARFGVPVRAQNDGILSIIAEKHAGKARDVDWAVTITIGTGIGSGVMLDGRILDDPHFMFGGQLGHLVMNMADEHLCLTGARGTGEMMCSATALALAVRSGLQRGIPSSLSEKYFANAHSIDFRTVIDEGVAIGDPLCIDEFRIWKRNLGWLLVNAVHAYSPQIIVLCGGATLAAEYFLAEVQEHVNQHIFRHPRGGGVPVVVSDIASHAGVLGAAMMMKSHFGK